MGHSAAARTGAKAAALEYDRRAPIRVGGHIVVTELRTNADIAERCETSFQPVETRKIETQEWRWRRSEMAALKDEDPRLWEDLELAYGQLELSKRDAAHPPPSAHLRELADRLDAAAG